MSTYKRLRMTFPIVGLEQLRAVRLCSCNHSHCTAFFMATGTSLNEQEGWDSGE